MANKQELRRLWFKVHKWMGLTLAAPVILIFLSGAMLVWKDSVDELVHPHRQVSVAPTQAAPFYLAAAQRVLAPGEHVVSLTYPRSRGAVIVTVTGPGMGGWMRYYLHPATGAVLDRAPLYSRPMRIIHVLHGSLLLGRTGGRFVGFVAIALLLSAFSGSWLWWPSKGAFTRGMRWRRTQDTNANLHHQSGYLIVLPLVVLSLTGASISFPGYFAAMVGETPTAKAEIERGVAAPLAQPRSRLGEVLATAGVSAQDHLVSVVWPTALDPRWRISFESGRGGVAVAVEDGTGKATVGRSGPPETTARLMRRIHDGTGMSLVWQIIIFAGGLLGATLAVTGVIMWLTARARDLRMRDRRSARAAT